MVDDRPLMREVLSRQVESDDRFRLVSNSNIADALHLISVSGQPELVVLAINEADKESVFHLARQLKAHSPGTLLFGLFDEVAESSVLPYLEAGVRACASFETSWDELARHLLDVRRGRIHCSAALLTSVLERIRELTLRSHLTTHWPVELSQRERDVARLMATGCSNKEIAQGLQISLSTAKNHVHSILTKLNLNRRRELFGHTF